MERKIFRLSLPLVLTLGGMILLGITTTTLGFLLRPKLDPHLDTSTEGWPDAGSGADAQAVQAVPADSRDAGSAPDAHGPSLAPDAGAPDAG